MEPGGEGEQGEQGEEGEEESGDAHGRGREQTTAWTAGEQQRPRTLLAPRLLARLDARRFMLAGVALLTAAALGVRQHRPPSAMRAPPADPSATTPQGQRASRRYGS